ncbi:uncharacterized protein LOC130512406 [Raphanus sativus]|uniref:Uncharacterized protein LOC130512406 n=1 Tax=Raphanus sativus TaxID=3726 RepID=A0A9W3DRA9_RAPSA|nr:uncharacterized protein LOC130512406 [Raphanus sativus]XP_056866347.1 uncharacterized protein LOC130512406 [Raphanus sativus]XP_056866350.1 uncharacterized protein LOC130512406 [Raphanus sativus]
MGIFPGFGGWISQNTQQPKKSENVKSKPVRETKTHHERDEMEQLKLWRDANKKKQYQEPPPAVKMRVDHKFDGLSRMEMEFILGIPPQTAYDVLTNEDNISQSREKNDRALLTAVSRIVTPERDEGPGHRPIVKVEKELAWKFLFLSGTLPIRLIVLENPKKLRVLYLKDAKGIRTMETFEGSYTVEPLYVDAERLCKRIKPKSPEEYRKCSGGKGRIASKVKVEQTFRPASPWDLPLLSSYMRRFTVETTKKVAEDLQMRASDLRGIPEYKGEY